MKTLYDSKGKAVQVEPCDVREYILSGEYSTTKPEGSENNAGGDSGAGALRDDGPTVAEYVEAGYPAKSYPPSGYASKSTDEEVQAAIKAQEEAEAAKNAGAGAPDAGGNDGGAPADGNEGGAGAAGAAGGDSGAGEGNAMPAYDDITVPQIRERLEKKGVTVSASITKKSDLYELLKGA